MDQPNEQAKTESAEKEGGDLGTLAAQLVKLADQKDLIEQSLGALSKKMSELKNAMLAKMQQTGVSKIKAGSRTCYLHRELWAKKEAEKEQCLDALRDAGLGEMIAENYNSSTLSSYMRKLPRDAEDMPVLPPELSSAFTVSERYDVRLRKT